MYKIAIFA